MMHDQILILALKQADMASDGIIVPAGSVFAKKPLNGLAHNLRKRGMPFPRQMHHTFVLFFW
jgi:hypothetical protein